MDANAEKTYEFVSEVVGGAIPKEYIPAVDAGIQEAMKSGILGGMLPFASAVKGPHENLDQLNAYLQKQLELAGVTVVTDTEVTADTVAQAAPDALVLACGGARTALDLGGEGVEVVDLEQFMFADLGDNVVVYGSNAQAFDCALWLTVHKKHVVMVTPNTVDELDMQQSQHAQRFMTTALYALGLQVYTEASITGVADGQITVTSASAGVDYTVPCSQVINAADMVANTGLLDEVSVAETYAIGDCASPFSIALAIRGLGYWAGGRTLGRGSLLKGPRRSSCRTRS